MDINQRLERGGGRANELSGRGMGRRVVRRQGCY